MSKLPVASSFSLQAMARKTPLRKDAIETCCSSIAALLAKGTLTLKLPSSTVNQALGLPAVVSSVNPSVSRPSARPTRVTSRWLVEFCDGKAKPSPVDVGIAIAISSRRPSQRARWRLVNRLAGVLFPRQDDPLFYARRKAEQS